MFKFKEVVDIGYVAWTEELEEKLLDLYEEYPRDWTRISELMGEGHTYHSVRLKYKRLIKDDFDNEILATTEYQDGTFESKAEAEFKAQKIFTKSDLLKLHNLDPKEFQIKTIKRNKWSVTNGDGIRGWNYQSTIVAEPIKENPLSPEKVEKYFKDLKPRYFELKTDEVVENYLLIPLADMHFGHNSLSDYQDLLNDILDHISDGYAEILISLHGDYFHVDNLLGTTEKGTKVDEVDLHESIKDGFTFIASIIENSLQNSPCVKLVYLPGNHAPSNDMIFTMGLKHIYPDLEVDDTPDDYKHSWLGNHSIFMHHGDKIKDTKRLLDVIVSEFAKEWGESQSRYLVTGHFHHEKSLSTAGMTHYQVQSPSKASGYDKRQGYVTSEDGVMLFKFDKQKRRGIEYL